VPSASRTALNLTRMRTALVTGVSRRTGIAFTIARRSATDGMAVLATGWTPMGRWGRPQDTAELVSWLVSEAGGWVTGQTLVSDGGWSVRG